MTVPRNVTAQLHHRAAGNPPSTLPDSAISNCFPGLEFDFRNVWRRLFVGIEIHEANGYVVSGEGELARLAGRYLVEVAGRQTWVVVHGPTDTEEDAQLGSAFMEWSNSMAEVVRDNDGAAVPCTFFDPGTETTEVVDLPVRPLFERSQAGDEPLAVIDEALAQPGELTQSLCSPWQNDYRECGCYYWASSRPDYVNVETTGQGSTVGNNWLAREREPKEYDVEDARLVGYEDLFRDWQALLRFIVGGRDFG